MLTDTLECRHKYIRKIWLEMKEETEAKQEKISLIEQLKEEQEDSERAILILNLVYLWVDKQ